MLLCRHTILLRRDCSIGIPTRHLLVVLDHSHLQSTRDELIEVTRLLVQRIRRDRIKRSESLLAQSPILEDVHQLVRPQDRVRCGLWVFEDNDVFQRNGGHSEVADRQRVYGCPIDRRYDIPTDPREEVRREKS